MTVSGKQEILRQTAAIMQRIEQLPLDVRREVLNGLYDGDFGYSDREAKLFYDPRTRLNLCDGAISEYSDDHVLKLAQKLVTERGPPFTTDSAMLGLCQELEALRLANAAHVSRLQDIKESLQKSSGEAAAFIEEIRSLIYSTDIQISNGKGGFYSGSYALDDAVSGASVRLLAKLPKEEITGELVVLNMRAVRYRLAVENIGRKISSRSGEIAAEVAFGAFDMGRHDDLRIEDMLHAVLAHLPEGMANKSLAETVPANRPVVINCAYRQDKKGNLRQRSVHFSAGDVQFDKFPRKIEDTFVAGVRRRSDIETFGGDRFCLYFNADGALLSEKPGIFARAAIAFNFSSGLTSPAGFARQTSLMTQTERAQRVKSAVKLLPPDVQRGVILRINSDYLNYAMAGFAQRQQVYISNAAYCNDAALKLQDAAQQLTDARSRIERLHEVFKGMGAASVFAGIISDLDAIRAQHKDVIDKAEGQPAENEALKKAVEASVGRIAVHIQGQNAAGLPGPEIQSVIAALSIDYDNIPDEASIRLQAYQAAVQNIQTVTARAVEELDLRLQEISNAARTAQGFLQAAGDLSSDNFGLVTGASMPEKASGSAVKPRRL